MAQKATHRQTDPSSPTPVVLFGVDENGKPKAARFPETQADLATKAAEHLKLHVLPGKLRDVENGIRAVIRGG